MRNREIKSFIKHFNEKDIETCNFYLKERKREIEKEKNEKATAKYYHYFRFLCKELGIEVSEFSQRVLKSKSNIMSCIVYDLKQQGLSDKQVALMINRDRTNVMFHVKKYERYIDVLEFRKDFNKYLYVVRLYNNGKSKIRQINKAIERIAS